MSLLSSVMTSNSLLSHKVQALTLKATGSATKTFNNTTKRYDFSAASGATLNVVGSIQPSISRSSSLPRDNAGFDEKQATHHAFIPLSSAVKTFLQTNGFNFSVLDADSNSLTFGYEYSVIREPLATKNSSVVELECRLLTRSEND